MATRTRTAGPSRRDFLRTAAMAGAAPFLLPQRPARAADRPNIVFMYADDQAQESMGFSGNQVIQTPNMDRLAAEGTYFNNAFVTTAICCSSRASILTGQHMRRHGILDFAQPLSAEQFAQTYPALLRDAGYRTAYLGKYAIGAHREDIMDLSLPAGEFDEWYGFPQSISFKQEVDGETRYLTDEMTQRAVDFMKTTPEGQPFCLTVAYKEPHGPLTYFDPDFPNYYEGVHIPEPKTLTKEAYAKLPEFIKTSLGGSGETSRFVDDPEAYQDYMRELYAYISRMDESVGIILDALAATGLDDNTIVIFSSDHGSFLGAHGMSGKWLMHEESIRVPLMIRDGRLPKSQRGKRHDAMALNIDWAPTMLDYAGVDIPDAMQGKSLRPLVEGESSDLREDWFYEHVYQTGPNRDPIPPSVGVRSKDWKYIRYTDEQPEYEELFHLEADPHELNNLAQDPAHQEKLAQMRTRCDEYMQSLK